MDGCARREFLRKAGLTIVGIRSLTSKRNIEAKAENVPNEELLKKMNITPYSGACFTDPRDFPDLYKKGRADSVRKVYSVNEQI